MKQTIVLLTAALAAFTAITASGQDPQASKTSVRGITRTGFQGWQDALLLDSRQTPLRAIIVPGVGGRVLFYGSEGDNLLWVNPDAAGKTAQAAAGVFDPGGFVIDLGPEAARLDPGAGLLVGPWDPSLRKNQLVHLQGPEDKKRNVEFEKSVMFDPSTGELGFLHRVKNTGDRDAMSTLTHRIACRPGGFAILPLSKKSRFAAGWSLRRDTGGRSSYDGTKPESPDVQILDQVLIAKTGGSPTRVGADSDAQWVAYATGRSLFVIHFPVYASATYSEGGNSVTIDWDERRTELQPHSAEQRVRSRKYHEFPLKWSILELPAEVTSHAEARALVEKVPGSPFL